MFLLAAFIAAPALALAQQTESRITGRVLDQSQAALPGVTVTATSKSTGAVRTDVTDDQGNYGVTNLGPGAYMVSIELSGFAPKTREVVLGVDQSEKVEVELGVAALTESVTAAPVLDLSSAKIGVNVSPEEVENLPVNGRNFANLMTLATGATSDGTADGRRFVSTARSRFGDEVRRRRRPAGSQAAARAEPVRRFDRRLASCAGDTGVSADIFATP